MFHIFQNSKAHELVNFTGISLMTTLFSLYKLIMDASKLTQRNKNVKILFLVGSTVNVLFLTCHLFQQYKHCDVSNIAKIQLNN